MNTTRFLRLPEVCNITGLSRGGIYKLVRESKFPPPVKLTERSSGWRDDLVKQWADARKSDLGRGEQPKGGTKC